MKCSFLLRGGLRAAVLLSALSAVPAAAQGQRPPDHITSDEAIACIRAATASQAGRVEGLEVEVRAGKVICEVEIVAENGRKSEVHVDVSTNQVVDTRPD